MKKALLVTIIGAFMLLHAPLALSDEMKVASLRGDHELDKDAKAIDKKKQLKVEGGFKRSWDLQPPGIPHDISKDSITITGNTCMRCHSKENFEKEKAPAIGESHYKNRDGKVLDKPSSRRWFCNQCHVPQVDAKPLIENTF